MEPDNYFLEFAERGIPRSTFATETKNQTSASSKNRAEAATRKFHAIQTGGEPG